MSKRYTTESFKDLLLSMYGNSFGWDSVIYQSSRDKIQVECFTHGPFWKTANHLQQGRCNCPICSKAKPNSRRKSTEDFIKEVNEVQPIMDTSEVIYIDSKTKVIVTCKVHNFRYKATPSHLLNGRACKFCRIDSVVAKKTKTTQEFVEVATYKTRGLYDYSRVCYVKSYLPVDIICNSCASVFRQTPTSHLAGSGCPNCTSCGYNDLKEGFLYVLQAGNITKVGITNRSVVKRLKQISKGSGFNFKVVYYKAFEKGIDARSTEKQALSYLRSVYTNIEKKFDGSTECFYDVDTKLFLDLIESLISELYNSQ